MVEFLSRFNNHFSLRNADLNACSNRGGTDRAHTGAVWSTPRFDEEVYERRRQGDVCIVFLSDHDGMGPEGMSYYDVPSFDVCPSTTEVDPAADRFTKRIHSYTGTCWLLQLSRLPIASLRSSHSSHIVRLYITTGRSYLIMAVNLTLLEPMASVKLTLYRGVFSWRRD